MYTGELIDCVGNALDIPNGWFGIALLHDCEGISCSLGTVAMTLLEL